MLVLYVQVACTERWPTHAFPLGGGLYVGGTVIVEYWTDSRRAVVVTGGPAELARIARQVGASSDELIPVAPHKLALALWGEALDTYVTAGADAAVRGGIGRLQSLGAPEPWVETAGAAELLSRRP